MENFHLFFCKNISTGTSLILCNYFFFPLYSSETVSFARPFARRAANTRRPFFVAILSRKPCLFFLFLLEGWNVLFIFLYFYMFLSKKYFTLFSLQNYSFFLDWQSFTKGILTIFDKILFKETHYSTHKLCSHSLIGHRFKWKACRQHLIITNICNTGTLSITIKNK